MSKVFKAEDMLKLAIGTLSLTPGKMVSITTNCSDIKTYCIIGRVSNDSIVFYRTINKDTTLATKFTADDISEYDLRIEVL